MPFSTYNRQTNANCPAASICKFHRHCELLVNNNLPTPNNKEKQTRGPELALNNASDIIFHKHDPKGGVLG